MEELRHQHDAILVGVGTVIADNPLLTDRTQLPRRRPLLRVVMDSHLRLPLHSRVAETASHDVLVFCSLAEEKKKQQLQEHGIQVEQVASGGVDGRPDLEAICHKLAEREITSVMIVLVGDKKRSIETHATYTEKNSELTMKWQNAGMTKGRVADKTVWRLCARSRLEMMIRRTLHDRSICGVTDSSSAKAPAF